MIPQLEMKTDKLCIPKNKVAKNFFKIGIQKEPDHSCITCMFPRKS